jgi:hypothetical protein
MTKMDQQIELQRFILWNESLDQMLLTCMQRLRHHTRLSRHPSLLFAPATAATPHKPFEFLIENFKNMHFQSAGNVCEWASGVRVYVRVSRRERECVCVFVCVCACVRACVRACVLNFNIIHLEQIKIY